MENTENQIFDSRKNHHAFEINTTIKDTSFIILHNDLAHETESNVWHSDWHYHANCEIIILLSGEEKICYENSFVPLSTGDICIIPQKMPHCCIPVSEKQQRSSLLIKMNTKESKISEQEQLLYHILYDLVNESTAPLVLKNSFSLCKEFENMLQVLNPQNSLISIIFKFQISLLVFRCLNAAYQLFPEYTPYGKFDIFFYDLDSANIRNKLIESYLYHNYQKNYPIEKLAEYINLSVRQTRREIIKQYGVGYNEIINEYRIRKAKQLLLNNKKIDFVAESIGFESVSGFRKAFQRATGVKLSDFLKQNQNTPMLDFEEKKT